MSCTRAFKLIVRDMHVDMHIGIFEADKTTKHPLLINLEADVLLPENWQADDYSQVLGYDKLVIMIRQQATAGHIHLLETFAETMAQACFAWKEVVAVKIRIEKPKMFHDCIAGVEISRSRPPSGPA